jgi:hypothetical protein
METLKAVVLKYAQIHQDVFAFTLETSGPEQLVLLDIFSCARVGELDCKRESDRTVYGGFYV